MLKLIAMMMLAATGRADPSVVYGDDHRLEVFESEWSQAAAATAIVFARHTVQDRGNSYETRGLQFGESFGLCEEERFFEQPLLGYCSSFLVAPNVVATAGHCIKSEFDCRQALFAFDYGFAHHKDEDLRSIHKASVYSCKRIIKLEMNPQNGNDLALIELDREVEGRSPLQLRRGGQLVEDDPLVVIGNPSGLPTKVAGGGALRHDQETSNSFVANLDASEGSSGSAVLNARTGEVEGILVRGEADFVRDPERRCRRSKQCSDDSCRGETVIRSSEIFDSLQNSSKRSMRYL